MSACKIWREKSSKSFRGGGGWPCKYLSLCDTETSSNAGGRKARAGRQNKTGLGFEFRV